ncbi:hypothetical protein L1887_12023 [Cichorium endivia]|nr:hypothetical protein L1887_12023 [Cichorium endivia]
MDDGRKFSLKDKIKQSLCFSCCFTGNRVETLRSESTSSTGDNNKRPVYLIGASSQWIKSRAAVDLPEIKDKCRNIFGRIGCSNARQNHRRRRSSTDFRYDPLSYALNFEEDSFGNLEDDAPLKDFSSRLPSSPPQSSTAPSLTTADHQATLHMAAVS